MSPKDSIQVRVRPNNRYGEAGPGAVLVVTRHELETHPHCLEEARPIPEAPRTAVVQVPAAKARALGLPLGRRQEGVIAFEVTRLAPGQSVAPESAGLEALQAVDDVLRQPDDPPKLSTWMLARRRMVEIAAAPPPDVVNDLRQALAVAQQNEATARAEAARLTRELAAATAPKPEPETKKGRRE